MRSARAAVRFRVAMLGLLALAAGVTAEAADRPADGADRLADAALAEVGDRLITLSDLALARALGLLGLERSDGPLTDGDLDRYMDARLAVSEAIQLGIEVQADDVDRAWEAAGGAALAARLEAVGVGAAWARQLIEDDLRVDRFVDVRFRVFAFVTDTDVDEALGPGAHDEAQREQTRSRLRDEQAARALARWRQDAGRRIRMRRIDGAVGPWPAPFVLSPAPAR